MSIKKSPIGPHKTLLLPVREAFAKEFDQATCEVHIRSRLRLRDYAKITPPKYMALLKNYATAMTGKKLVFVNATYIGGGVAIMRAPLIALLRCAGVDAHWYVLQPDEEAFKITKWKFHNVLQNVAGPGVELTAADKAVYEAWMRQNATALAEPLRTADVIVIDDWQPSGLIPYIKGQDTTPGLNPAAKIIFRDHIQTEGKLMGTPGTAQFTTWSYIWNHNRVSDADIFVAHPKNEFVPPDVPNEKVVFMPASSDLLDDLNRPLLESETKQAFAFINKHLQSADQPPIDLQRQYLVLVARFDPSKGMPQGLASYVSARQKMAQFGLTPEQMPQLVICGNGSVDDPDGLPILREIMSLRSQQPADIQDDIKVVRLPDNDLAINALIHGAALALQPSTKEGFESRVTDAILRGVPVIGSAQGGIPLQIVDGRSGYVIDPNDTEQWAERICQLMTNKEQYASMKVQTEILAKSHNYEFTTVPNAINWLALSYVLVAQSSFNGNREWVRDRRETVAPADVARFKTAIRQYKWHIKLPGSLVKLYDRALAQWDKVSR